MFSDTLPHPSHPLSRMCHHRNFARRHSSLLSSCNWIGGYLQGAHKASLLLGGTEQLQFFFGLGVLVKTLQGYRQSVVRNGILGILSYRASQKYCGHVKFALCFVEFSQATIYSGVVYTR